MDGSNTVHYAPGLGETTSIQENIDVTKLNNKTSRLKLARSAEGIVARFSYECNGVFNSMLMKLALINAIVQALVTGESKNKPLIGP